MLDMAFVIHRTKLQKTHLIETFHLLWAPFHAYCLCFKLNKLMNSIFLHPLIRNFSFLDYFDAETTVFFNYHDFVKYSFLLFDFCQLIKINYSSHRGIVSMLMLVLQHYLVIKFLLKLIFDCLIGLFPKLYFLKWFSISYFVF